MADQKESLYIVKEAHSIWNINILEQEQKKWLPGVY